MTKFSSFLEVFSHPSRKKGSLLPFAAVLALFTLFFLGIGSSATAGGPPEKVTGKASDLSDETSPVNMYVPDELLVRFRVQASEHGKASAHSEVGATDVKKVKPVENLYRVRLPKGKDLAEARDLYRKNPNVLYAEPNWIVEILATPNDPSFSSLWGLHNTGQSGGTVDADIDALEAWDSTTGGTDAVVVVIDTGVDYNHQDLTANMFQNTGECSANGIDDDGNGFVDDCYGIDTVNNDSNPMDDHDHGTHVAGTIGAVGNNALGVVGVNWAARIMACKFLSAAGSGTTADAIECLNYVSSMKDRGVNIIATSNSWGGDAYSQALYDAIEAQRQRGILFIAAAGNDAKDNEVSPSYPAAYYLPNVVSVAASTRTDALASFSNYGRRTVHLGAPGSSILSTTPSNTYTTLSGTSMATPHVTGVAALLKAQDSSRDWRAIKNLILAGGDATTAMASKTVTGKRLNANGALTCSGSTVASRLRPFGTTIKGTVGTPISLAALHINCANPNGDVTITVGPSGELLTLLDDGLGVDQGIADGIYSGQWTPLADGTYTLSFPGGDSVTVNVGKPDLIETSVSDPPETASPGSQFAVSDSTLNQGAITAAVSYTRYYFSLDTAWSSTDKLLTGSRSVPILSPQASSTGALTVTVPSTVGNGIYYLLACADDTKVVSEKNEANNCIASASTVTILLSDLVETSITDPPALASPGVSFSVTDTVENQGLASAPASYTRYYLSLDTVWNSIDNLLTGSRSVPSLAPQASSTGSVTVTVSSTVANGVYYLLACADDYKTITEGDEANNCRASAVTVQVDLPDLLISAVDDPPATIPTGGTFSVTDTTLNQGLGPAPNSTTAHYLYSTFDSSYFVLGTRSVPALAGGESSTDAVTATVTIWNIKPGIYSFRTCADRSNAIKEANDTNNCVTASTTVTVQGPDLVETSITDPPASASPGASFSVTDTVRNQGLGTSPFSTTYYYFSLDATFGGGDIFLGSRSAPILESGAESTGTMTVIVPSTTAPGTYYLLACADGNAQVKEESETNNCITASTTMTIDGPDLVETSITDPPASASPGASFLVTDTVENQGLASAPSSYTRYYLSLDTLWSSTDKLLTGSRSVPSLTPQASSTGSVTVTVPSTVANGVYYLLACADDTKVITEGDEANNCRVSTASVTVFDSSGVDLSVTNTDSPDPVLVGKPLAYTIVVENRGPDDASSVTLTDQLSSKVSFVSATPSQGSCSGTTLVTCELAALSAGSSTTVTIVVTPNASGEISNKATVSSAVESDSNGNNNVAEIKTLVVVAKADLSVTNIDSPDPVTVGSPLTYTITISNTGPNTATGVNLTDQLSSKVSFVSATPTQGSCSGTTIVTCLLDTISVGSSVSVTIVVTPNASGEISNKATVKATEKDPSTGNNVAQIKTVVVLP